MENKGKKIHRYSKDEIAFLKANSYEHSRNELAAMFNEQFGTNLTTKQIKATCCKRGFYCKNDGKFRKGLVPFCKGMSKEEWESYLSEKSLANIRKTQFKKGHCARVDYPIGHEVWRNGYLMIKVTNDRSIPCNKRWVFKHNLIFEQWHNEKIPKGHIVIFKDGDNTNFDIENLMLISRQESVRLAKWNAYGKGDMTQLYAKTAKLLNCTSKTEKHLNERIE